MTEILKCPECGADMILRTTTKFTYKNGQPRKFFGCSAWPQTGCSGIHGADPSGKPLGIPADKETKQWRMRAHEVFDRLWKQYGYSRGGSYALLQQIMGLSAKDAHISRFNIAQCKKLIARLSLQEDHIRNDAVLPERK